MPVEDAFRYAMAALLSGLATSLYHERTVGRRIQRLETAIKVIAGHLKITLD